MQLAGQVACLIFYFFSNLHRHSVQGFTKQKMETATHLQTDAHITYLVEVLLQEIHDLKASVNRLESPITAQLYTEEEAAALLNVSKKSLYRWRLDGMIHYYQMGDNIRYSLRDILEFEKGCRR